MLVNAWRLKYKLAPKKKGKRSSKGYRGRKFALSELGYDSYPAYLASDDWKAIRAEKLRDYPKCFLCPAPASQVHHLDYDARTLLGLEPRLLVTLCDGCHGGIEFRGSEKRHLADANKELRRQAAGSGAGRKWLCMLARLREERKRLGIKQGPAFNHKRSHPRAGK